MEASYNLSGAHLSQFPDTIPQDVTQIFLARNQIGSLPSSISDFTRLKCLQLSLNMIERLPPEIGALTHLTALYVAFNRLNQVPEEIGNLVQLKELILTANQLTALPASLEKLTALEELFISANRIRTYSVEKFTHLKVLLSSGNCLESYPNGLDRLDKLESLNLNFNRLHSIPLFFTSLTSLKKLSLSYNLIEEVPPFVGQMTHLRELELSHNLITNLPNEIGRLTSLQTLALNGNPLTDVPPLVAALPGFIRLRPLELVTVEEVLTEWGLDKLSEKILEHKQLLKIWLQKLKITKEFEHRKDVLKSRVKDIFLWLDSAVDKDLFEIAIGTIKESNKGCQDAALNGYNELSLLKKQSEVSKRDDKSLIELILGNHLLRRLREVGKKVMSQFLLKDEVETFLYMEIALKGPLKLPIETQYMDHEPMAGISPLCLENVKNALLKEIDSREKKASILSQNLIWQKRVEQNPLFDEIKRISEEKKRAFLQSVEGKEELFKGEFERHEKTTWNVYYHLTLNLL